MGNGAITVVIAITMPVLALISSNILSKIANYNGKRDATGATPLSKSSNSKYECGFETEANTWKSYLSASSKIISIYLILEMVCVWLLVIAAICLDDESCKHAYTLKTMSIIFIISLTISMNIFLSLKK